MLLRLAASALLLACGSRSAQAVSLAFSAKIAGGVLQHGETASIWGSGATPNAAVVVTLHTQPSSTVDTTADEAGNFSLRLPPQPVAWHVRLSALSAGVSTATTVSFGQTVLCAGQSNMDMPVACHLPNRTACFYPKLAFHADNGTAECAAAGRYTGKIWMMKAVNSKYNHAPAWQTATTTMQYSSYPAAFSAVCWYTGKSLFEQLGGSTPVGLLQTSVGGSPIEYWLPPEAHAPHSTENANACERDVPQCDNQYNDSFFFTDIVEQLTPYTLGSLVWDQAERDVKCPVATSAYACMQRLLIQTWRAAFKSPRAPFVAVQLPGYTGALNNGTGTYPGGVSAEMVFDMRLQQAAGTHSISNASYVATYDLSVPTSPYGSVHNVEKGPIGVRIATQLIAALRGVPVLEGPRATSAQASLCKSVAEGVKMWSTFTVTVAFEGGTAPFSAQGTKNCTSCCQGKHTLDFDVAAGDVWINATGGTVDPQTGAVQFDVEVPSGEKPTIVRYTAASIFPQCALKSAEGLPALPFALPISLVSDHK